jgi:shikimate kinase
MKALNFKKPHLLILAGIRGAGKTYFASHFSDTFDAPFVCDELIYKTTGDTDIKKIRSYFLAMLFKTNSTVILETDEANTPLGRLKLSKIAKRYGYEPIIIWVQTDSTTAGQRLNNNKHIKKEKDNFVSPSNNENFVVISGKHTYSTQLKIVLNKLSEAHKRAANDIKVAPREVNS